MGSDEGPGISAARVQMRLTGPLYATHKPRLKSHESSCFSHRLEFMEAKKEKMRAKENASASTKLESAGESSLTFERES
jgi:hypothetical protein